MAINRNYIYIAILSPIVVLSVIAAILVAENMAVRANFSKMIVSKYSEYSSRIRDEKELIVKEMEESNSGKNVVFAEIAKKIELEKQKVKNLLDKLPQKNTAKQQGATIDVTKERKF